MGEIRNIHNNFKYRIFTFFLFLILFLSLTLTLTLADTAILNITATTDSYWNTGVANNGHPFRIAQGFQLTNSSNITATDIYFGSKSGTGCAGSYWAEIQTDSSGLPSNTTIGITQKIFIDNLPTTSSQNFNFTSTVQTLANTPYWLVINHNETTTGCFIYIGYCASCYSGGNMAWSYPDYTWTAYGNDIGVILYGELTNATNETNEQFPAFNTTTDIILATDYTGANIWISRNGGINWTTHAVGGTLDWALFSDQNATNIITGRFNDGVIVVSHDAGNTWTLSNSTNEEWYVIKGTPNAQRLIASAYNGKLWKSNDYGDTWSITNNDTRNWTGLGMSKDGRIILAQEINGYIYKSTNGGNNWTTSLAKTGKWTYLACDENCTKIVALHNSNYAGNTSEKEIYISNDVGSTWTNTTTGTTLNSPEQVDMTPDGTTIIISYYQNGIGISNDGGTTFSMVNNDTRTWTGIATNTNASIYVVGESIGSGQIWRSDNGNNWSIITNETLKRWEAIFIPKQNMAVPLYEYCEENWTLDYNPCLINDSQFISYTDTNNCNTTENLPQDNGTWEYCDYCQANVTCDQSECIDGYMNINCTDWNFYSCCIYTMLETDCPIIEGYNQTRNPCEENNTCGVNLTEDFPCEYDEIPILQKKMNVVCEMPDTDTYDCVVNILQNETLLATTPEYRQSNRFLGFGEEGETRTSFESTNTILNAYYVGKNLRTDTPFMLEIICSSPNQTIKTQYCITPTYIKPDWILNKFVFIKQNPEIYIAITIVIIIGIGIFISTTKRF